MLDLVRALGNYLAFDFPYHPITDPHPTLVGGDSRMYLPPLLKSHLILVDEIQGHGNTNDPSQLDPKLRI